MTVSVLFPWRPGCPWRERALGWVRDRYEAIHPEWEYVFGGCPDGPFSRTQAILDAARCSHGDVLVVADTDVWCDPTEAVRYASETGWAVPHRMIHRLSPESTDLVLGGADWRGLPLSTDNRQDSRPYKGHLAGTLLAVTRDAFTTAPPDPRFVGWGQEDDAWSIALRTLVGEPWRGADDLVHLWHPAEPRGSRRVGNPANVALLGRYQRAHGRPDAMRSLCAENETVPA